MQEGTAGAICATIGIPVQSTTATTTTDTAIAASPAYRFIVDIYGSYSLSTPVLSKVC